MRQESVSAVFSSGNREQPDSCERGCLARRLQQTDTVDRVSPFDKSFRFTPNSAVRVVVVVYDHAHARHIPSLLAIASPHKKFHHCIRSKRSIRHLSSRPACRLGLQKPTRTLDPACPGTHPLRLATTSRDRCKPYNLAAPPPSCGKYL